MYIALLNGERATATPKAVAACQDCDRPVKAKCGSVNAWHWAHRSKEACEASRYGMTEWHAGWLRKFPEECVEIPLVVGGKKHIADVILNAGGGKKTVFEFQWKMMPPEVMLERETFWKKAGYDFRWIFDGTKARESRYSNVYDPRLCLYDKGTWHSFKWKQAPGRLVGVELPYFVDLGEEGLLEIKKLYANRPFGGWGYLKKYGPFQRSKEPSPSSPTADAAL